MKRKLGKENQIPNRGREMGFEGYCVNLKLKMRKGNDIFLQNKHQQSK